MSELRRWVVYYNGHNYPDCSDTPRRKRWVVWATDQWNAHDIAAERREAQNAKLNGTQTNKSHVGMITGAFQEDV